MFQQHIPQSEANSTRGRYVSAALISACGGGDAEFLTNWARRDPDGFGKYLGTDDNGAAALLHAVQCNHPECVLFIHVDANTASPGGRRPLIEASRLADVRLSRILLDHGGDPNLGDDVRTNTAMTHAARHGRREAVLLLLERGAHVNLQINGSSTALISAAFNGHLEVMNDLFEAGADPDLVDGDGRSPLFAALVGSHPEAAEMLLARGADVTLSEVPFRGGRRTVMTLATRGGYSNIAKRILDKVSQAYDECFQEKFINARSSRSSDRRTALMVACMEGSESVVQALMQHPEIDVDRQDDTHCTALSYAIRWKPSIAEALLALGASVKPDERAETCALVEATRYGRRGMVRHIPERGPEEAGLEFPGCCGKTALVWACKRNYVDIAEMLLQAGAAVDAPDSIDWTPLMYAVRCHGDADPTATAFQV
jgi:ankyrin repeat protein